MTKLNRTLSELKKLNVNVIEVMPADDLEDAAILLPNGTQISVCQDQGFLVTRQLQDGSLALRVCETMAELLTVVSAE